MAAGQPMNEEALYKQEETCGTNPGVQDMTGSHGLVSISGSWRNVLILTVGRFSLIHLRANFVNLYLLISILHTRATTRMFHLSSFLLNQIASYAGNCGLKFSDLI